MGSSRVQPYGFLVGFLILIFTFAMLIEAFSRANKYDRQSGKTQQSAARPPAALVMTFVLAPILLRFLVYPALPKAPEAQVRKGRMASAISLVADHSSIFEKLGEMNVGRDPTAALATYRKEAASIIAGRRKEHAKSEAGKNYLSGLPHVEEDSQGNYVIELKTGKPTYFYFDSNGRKIELGEIGRK